MSNAQIVSAGRPVLRERAKEVPSEELGTKFLSDLVKQMVETMRAAPGVGLAAPQIGVSKRVIVLEDADRLMSKLTPSERALRGRLPLPLTVVVNPILTIVGDAQATFFEGCLSVPGYMALVPRALEVEVTGVTERGDPFSTRVTGWPARIFQHEVDHLEGRLYVDRMLTRTFGSNQEVMDHWLALPVEETRKKLGA